MTKTLDFDLGEDLEFTAPQPRRVSGGVWMNGKFQGHRFQALVFSQHAENCDWELGDSRISKLWIQRMADKKVVFHWDRGLDIAAENDLAQAIVDFLAAGLAEHAFAK